MKTIINKAELTRLAVWDRAIHEAGHVIMCDLKGVAVLSAYANDQGGDCTHEAPESGEDAIAIALAGPEAWRLAGRGRTVADSYCEGGAKDYVAARTYAARLLVGVDWDEDYPVDRREQLTPDVTALVESIRRTTGKRLRADWAAVLSVAERLAAGSMLVGSWPEN